MNKDDVIKAIESCPWRKNMFGVFICKGNAGLCSRTLEDGRCWTLYKMYEKERKTDEID